MSEKRPEYELRMHRCCFSGHRPEKLPESEKDIRAWLDEKIDEAIADGYTSFISGMAMGVDLWAAQAVLRRREKNPEIRLICAVPWNGFPSRWSEQWKTVYFDVLKKADLVKIISEKYDDNVFERRNCWMADRSRRLIAYFNGAEGGTKNMVEYAAEKGLETVLNAPRDGAFEKWESPEAAVVSSAGLLSFVKAAEKMTDKVQFHSLILLRHGKLVCKMNWEPYDDVTPHTLFSLSKSFTSCAAGFAVSEGLLKWDSKVTDILPEEVPEGMETELSQITLENLLCMGSGLAEESDSPSPDPKVTWAKHVLQCGVKYPPMTHFHYNTFGTYLVSCMIQKVTGKTVRDYLVPRLFDPLGIRTPDWDLSPQGVCCGGFGLHLTSMDIARFGQCLLQDGKWHGRQILPEGWVELATKEHIANYKDAPEEGNEWAQGYGFQFWRCTGGRYRGDGAFGQVCMVDTKLDAVLAVTCGAKDMGAEYALIREHIFPAFDAEKATAREMNRLQQQIADLKQDFCEDDGSDKPLPEGEFFTQTDGMECVIRFEKYHCDLIRFTMRTGNEPWNRFDFYLPRGKAAMACVHQGMGLRFLGCYGWNKSKLHITARTPDGPQSLDGKWTWTKDKVCFDGVGVNCFDGKVTFTKKEAEQ